MLDAFYTIGEWLRSGAETRLDTSDFSPQECRLVHVVENLVGSSGAGVADVVTALRHVLRSEQERQAGVGQSFLVPVREPWPTVAEWEASGFQLERVRDHFRVEALPWKPTWLGGTRDDGIDGPTCAGALRRSYFSVAGDPFLSHMGLTTYVTVAQREAVRAVLTAPPGSTLVVTLPTGGGKSLCAHLPAMINAKLPGTVIVVVPTSALALDQERAMLPYIRIPTAYVSGVTEEEERRNREIRSRIRDGTQKIVFSSPESIIQSLAGSIYSAASEGLIDMLVVDEAHMIEEWGDDFRPAFQELAGLRIDLLRTSAKRFPTILLTATLTEYCLDSLETLFSGPGPFRLLASVQLRPEPSYWFASCGDSIEKEARVIEAVRHLPRPLILYTTTRVDANNWRRKLRSEGFLRSEVVTGDTPNEERLKTLMNWRGDRTDIVVATSAFGLGVDKPDVRVVIHACVPESIDRFYQEVGRGGRDGCASLSLMIYAPSDWGQARRIARKRLISLDRGRERWDSMFQKSELLDGGRIRVPVDAVPSFSEGDIDMRNSFNVEWNIRTLTLMARAGILRLDGEAPPQITNSRDSDTDVRGEPHAQQLEQLRTEFAKYENSRVVTILDQHHLDEQAWNQKVSPLRTSRHQFSRRTLQLMREVTSARQCVSQSLAETYTIRATKYRAGVAVELSCGGCPFCRGLGLQSTCGIVHSPLPVWCSNSNIGELLQSMLSGDNMMAVFYEEQRGREWARHRDGVVRWVIAQGLRNIVAPSAMLEEWRTVDWKGRILFFTALEELALIRLPWLPTLVFHPVGQSAPMHLYRRDSAPDAERDCTAPPTVVFFPTTVRDPTRDHRLLADVWPGRKVTFEELRAREAI